MFLPSSVQEIEISAHKLGKWQGSRRASGTQPSLSARNNQELCLPDLQPGRLVGGGCDPPLGRPAPGADVQGAPGQHSLVCVWLPRKLTRTSFSLACLLSLLNPILSFELHLCCRDSFDHLKTLSSLRRGTNRKRQAYTSSFGI
jgi:hypothetical protein